MIGTMLAIVSLAGSGFYVAFRIWKRSMWDAVKTDESEARVAKAKQP